LHPGYGILLALTPDNGYRRAANIELTLENEKEQLLIRVNIPESELRTVKERLAQIA